MKTNLLVITIFFLLFGNIAFSQNQLGNDILGTNSGDWLSHGLGISRDGSRVVAGAPHNSDNQNEGGQVRVLEWSQNSWQPVGLPMYSGIRGAKLGFSVAMSSDGNHIVAGAPGSNANFVTDPDFVRVYDWVNGAWVHTKPDIQGDRGNDFAGWDVAISGGGNTIAFSAPYGDLNGQNSGYVKVYKWENGAWAQLGNTIAGDSSFSEFGVAIALSEDGLRLAVGEPSNGDSLNGGGLVRVFEWQNTDWVQVGNDIYGISPESLEGSSVALSRHGNILATAAINYRKPGAAVTGQIRVLRWQNGVWAPMGNPVHGDSNTVVLGGGVPYGSLSISSDGRRLAAGTMNSSTSTGIQSGQVLVYDFVNNDWRTNVWPIYGSVAQDQSGRSAVLSADGLRLAMGSINHSGGGPMAGQVRMFDLTLRPTGITYAPQREDHKLAIYPNPTTGIIKLHREDRGTLTIMDSLGRLVLRKENPGEDPIDLRELARGKYMVFFDSEGKRRMAKLTKL